MMIRSRMRRCARQFSLAMNFQCRGITAEECEPFRELFGLETSNVSLREHLVEKKCCERRCSLQVLRSLCCFE
ncbi:hypothetical protein RB195_026172 [Necator americanus]|uniref:Insulin-like domain-containing protein n=1 Tax=Necator americanus TaxID=51031 RepID=A0ABR1EVS6_NECAM